MVNSAKVVFVDDSPLQFSRPQSPILQSVLLLLHPDFAQTLPAHGADIFKMSVCEVFKHDNMGLLIGNFVNRFTPVKAGHSVSLQLFFICILKDHTQYI